MELPDIETSLNHPDFQYRLKAIAALKTYDAEVAVPILIGQLQDPEFLVRSFVAMGLGKHQTADTFAALLQILKWDNTPNVRAEAANSLSLFGQVSVSHLVLAFEQDQHWLVRRSILAALLDLDAPHELLEICAEALKGRDLTVQEAALDALQSLAKSPQQSEALALLLPFAQDELPRLRSKAAKGLKQFDAPLAQAALAQLRQDPDPMVVAATWSNPLAETPDPST